MHLRVVAVSALIACLGLVARVEAQQQPVQPQNARFGDPTSIARTLQGYVYGVIKKIDAHELVLDKTEFGDDQVFKLESKTKFIHDGKGSSLADLKVGDKVWVDVKKDKKTGDRIARKVVTGANPAQAPQG